MGQDFDVERGLGRTQEENAESKGAGCTPVRMRQEATWPRRLPATQLLSSTSIIVAEVWLALTLLLGLDVS